MSALTGITPGDRFGVAVVDDEPELTEEQQFLRDNDSLFVLPLRHVPLETSTLRRGRLVKNFALEPVVEVFRYPEFGRGYFLVEDLANRKTDSILGWEVSGRTHPDARLLHVLGGLHSYDVYSLRIRLRELEIEYEGIEYLTLSWEMKKELAVYMRQFTLPLLNTIYGETDTSNETDVIELFRNPSTVEARVNLERFARKLNIETDAIADFLEMFADVYLAISYYRHYTDQISKEAALLFSELDDIVNELRWRGDLNIMVVCNHTKQILKALLTQVFGRLDVYERETRNFWKDLDPDRFRYLRDLVRESQVTIAGVLCGIGVKLAGWRERFPMNAKRGMHSKYEAVQTDLRPGLEKLLRLVSTGEEVPMPVPAVHAAGVEMTRVVA